ARNMITELERTDDSDVPVYIPGNPVKMSKVADGPDTRIPWVGEHTDSVLREELGIDSGRLAELRAEGVIN
ncbi:MAG TPA: CoA transferase, partial [Microthrixaceae bacterium]|nr:CoA transferase [Microthrixaceae bacterium]